MALRERSNANEQIAHLEVLLFVHGEPLSYKKISGALEVTEKEARYLVEDYKERLRGDDRGLTLITDSGKAQLVTKPQFAHVLSSFIEEQLSDDLTSAALEALSVVAYLGPLSRSRLEYVRGVNSSFILRSLLMRGLIERRLSTERSGGYLYQLSFDALKYLGVTLPESLPRYSEFRGLLERFEQPDVDKEETAPAAEGV